MAEAWLRKHGGQAFEVFSAGLEPAGVNPYTVRVMEEIGVDMTNHSSKSLDEYLGKVHFGYVIIVCSNADEKCPAVFPGMGQRLHWPFDDPAALEGSDEDKLAKFRQVRDQIEKQVKEWLSQLQHRD
jgi:arsenate reductase